MIAPSPAPVLIGTAGHIDHGKTSLVRRLTGVDTDRLPEEKRRGITIVLGFAPLTLPSGRRVGVVDIPGHERFVKNMVAGAGGIDIALLVVAADEGVMPQTREHLEICGLLGVRAGLVALTKIDRYPELVPLAEEDVRAQLAGTFLEGARIIPCSSVTGEGLDVLTSALEALITKLSPRPPSALAFLPIDRAFMMRGFGSVITGTLASGTVASDAQFDVLPPLKGQPALRGIKVRGLHVFGAPVARAEAGQRTAVNLQGVALDALAPGQALVSPGAAAPTRKLSVRLVHLASRERALKSGARILFHTGTALVEAGLTLLDADALEPGATGLATVRLRAPIVTLLGQRFIARGFDGRGEAGHTLGGGIILDPEPPRRRRRVEATLSTLAHLDALATLGPKDGRLEAALVALVDERGASGLAPEVLARRLARPLAEVERTALSESMRGKAVLAGGRAIAESALSRLREKVLARVENLLREQPFRTGVSLAEIVGGLGAAAPRAAVDLVLKRLVAEQRLIEDREGFSKAALKEVREAAEAKSRVLAALNAKGLEPPTGSELEAESGLATAPFRALMASLVRAGEVIHLGQGIYYSVSTHAAAEVQLREYCRAHGELSAAEAKSVFKLSRKFLIPLLESFDKAGVTVRVGDVRRLKTSR